LRTVLWVREALRGRALVREFETFADLHRAIHRDVPAIDVVIISPYDRIGADGVGLVREIAREFPDVAIVAQCSGGLCQAGVVRELSAAGAHQLLFGIEDSRSVIQSVVQRARRECAADRVLAGLTPEINAELVPLLEACLTRPGEVMDVASLVRAAGAHRRTLHNRCRRAGLSGPAEFIGWCRVGIVAYLLGRTHRTVESIALELDFASPTALRNLLKRYTGLRATEIRNRGGLSVVIEALRRRLGVRRGLHLA
jgi:AraC-like DNA-binding protein